MVLDRAHRELAAELPERAAGWIAWIRAPKRKWIRLPVAIIFIGASFFAFLPGIGIELLPLGLLLLSEDVRFLRTPMGKVILWLIGKWRTLKAWWRTRKQSQ